MGQELCFVETNPWTGQGLVEREPSLTGCCPYKSRVFWGSHCAGILRMYQCENIGVSKKAFCLHFTKFCVFNIWNACFGNLIAFCAVRNFGPDFWAVSNLEAICWSMIWGGAKRMGGGKLTRERALPSKRASGQKCRGFLHRRNRALTPKGGQKNKTK